MEHHSDSKLYELRKQRFQRQLGKNNKDLKKGSEVIKKEINLVAIAIAIAALLIIALLLFSFMSQQKQCLKMFKQKECYRE